MSLKSIIAKLTDDLTLATDARDTALTLLSQLDHGWKIQTAFLLAEGEYTAGELSEQLQARHNVSRDAENVTTLLSWMLEQGLVVARSIEGEATVYCRPGATSGAD